MLRRTAPRGWVIASAASRMYEPKAKHFLAVHDAVKQNWEHCQVVANVSERRPFQSHMQLLFDPLWFDPSRTDAFSQKLQSTLSAGVVELQSPYRLTVKFYDNTLMIILMGTKGCTLDHLMQADHDMEREAIRASLGADEYGYMTSRPEIITTAASYAIQQQRIRMGDEGMYLVPRFFWMAMTEAVYERSRNQNPGQLAMDSSAFIERRIPLPNPILPEENLMDIPSIRFMRGMGANQVVEKTWYAAGVHQELNVVDTGVVPTQEEYEKMLVDKGVFSSEPPPVAPGRRGGILGWLFGGGKREADDSAEAAAAAAGLKIPSGAVASSGYSFDSGPKPKTFERYGTMWAEMGRPKNKR